MVHYTIFNEQQGVELKHPKIGVWNTTNISEAREMLKACHEYLIASGLEEIVDSFFIINVVTKEKIK